ncbi:MAG: hypothetical protein LBK03_04500 [Bacteroidales bacterium]|jgi:type I pantothenate kinase|nr:hypothetical protein [Bacteroidales bacterium]
MDYENALLYEIAETVDSQKLPIISIAGGVAASKSTFAAALKTYLSVRNPKCRVQVLSTDSFLYPNKTLEKHGITKGFPKSYDYNTLKHVLHEFKGGRTVKVPVYLHEIYDILPEQEMLHADVLILEGINTLSDELCEFSDLSLFLSVDPKSLYDWFIGRFRKLIANAAPGSFYERYAKMPLDTALSIAKDVWDNVNAVNNEKYIFPTAERADLIVKIDNEHRVYEIVHYPFSAKLA